MNDADAAIRLNIDSPQPIWYYKATQWCGTDRTILHVVDLGQPNQVPVSDPFACVHCILSSLGVPCWSCTVLHANGDQAASKAV